MLNIFKRKKKKIARYSIHVELIKGDELIKKVFSPLAKSKARAIECIMLIAERQGYDGIKR